MRLGRCTNTVLTHQPTHVSHLVAIVCTNYALIDDHQSEDCIWDGYVSDDRASSASLVSLSETETDGESQASLATASSIDNDEALQAITPEQVLMTTLGGSGGGANRSSAPSSSPVIANASEGAATNIVLLASSPLGITSTTVAPSTPLASTPIGRSPLDFSALSTGPSVS